MNAVLNGVTHSDLDVSVDKIKTAALPMLLKFILVDDGLELKVVRRGESKKKKSKKNIVNENNYLFYFICKKD